MSHTLTPPRVEFDTEVNARLEDDIDVDYSGWYCIATNDFPCPASGCDFVARHMTAAHRIVVWPALDDRALLSYARDARHFGRNPHVTEYEPTMGPCIAYDLWQRLGRPVHGQHEPPPGWNDATRKRL